MLLLFLAGNPWCICLLFFLFLLLFLHFLLLLKPPSAEEVAKVLLGKVRPQGQLKDDSEREGLQQVVRLLGDVEHRRRDVVVEEEGAEGDAVHDVVQVANEHGAQFAAGGGRGGRKGGGR